MGFRRRPWNCGRASEHATFNRTPGRGWRRRNGIDSPLDAVCGESSFGPERGNAPVNRCRCRRSSPAVNTERERTALDYADQKLCEPVGRRHRQVWSGLAVVGVTIHPLWFQRV